MTDTSVIEGNKLIVEFMGKTYRADNGDGEQGYLFPRNGDFNRRIMPHAMQYHSSWDWLLPVWEKCKEIGLFMMTHGFDKLWIEKSKEIEIAILCEFDCKKAARLISLMIQWRNSQKEVHHG